MKGKLDARSATIDLSLLAAMGSCGGSDGGESVQDWRRSRSLPLRRGESAEPHR